jgi:hypothetical protein
VSEPTDDEPFDPYRYGAPERHIPAEFAPPGYEETGYHPPAPANTGPSQPYGAPPNPSAPPPYGPPPYGQAPPGPAPYGQPPYGQVPPGQPPYGQAPYGQAPYGQPGQYPPPPNYYGYQPPASGSNGKALAGLILGILSCVCFFFTIADILLIVPGFIFSALGLAEAKRSGVGRTKARWGLGLTVVGTVLAVAVLSFAIVLIKNTDCSISHSSNSFAGRICSSQNK